jgi:hypothetical protein
MDAGRTGDNVSDQNGSPTDHNGAPTGTLDSITTAPTHNGDSYSGLTSPPPPVNVGGSNGTNNASNGQPPPAPTAGFFAFDSGYACVASGTMEASYRNELTLYTYQGATYGETWGDRCNDSPAQVSSSQLDMSSYNPALIGYGSRIFEYRTQASSGTNPDGDIVAWCRTNGATATVGTDIFVRNTASGPEAAIVIGAAGQATRTAGPLAVTYGQSSNVRSYGASDGQPGLFSLTIGLTTGNTIPGYVSMRIDGQTTSSDLYCRILP